MSFSFCGHHHSRLMPTCTTMVIRMEKTEAKVESIAADVMQLEHDTFTQQGRHLDRYDISLSVSVCLSVCLSLSLSLCVCVCVCT